MLLGADPEFFVLNHNNAPINVINVIKNSKSNPIINSNHVYYYDNVAFEMNFVPSRSCQEFVSTIRKGIEIARNIVHPYKLIANSCVEFYEADKKNENFFEIGCEPDINAYTLSYNKINSEMYKHTLERFAGGHVHMGGYEGDLVQDDIMKPVYVYMLDLFVGIPSVILDHDVESYKRKRFYGHAGNFRPKHYGLEYRVLSPFWLRSPKTTELIYNLFDFVYNFMNDHIYDKFVKVYPDNLGNENVEEVYNIYGYDYKEIIKTINTNNVDQAHKFMNFISNFMPDKLIKDIEEESNFKKKSLEFYWGF
jgi:hypothetical protein